MSFYRPRKLLSRQEVIRRLREAMATLDRMDDTSFERLSKREDWPHFVRRWQRKMVPMILKGTHPRRVEMCEVVFEWMPLLAEKMGKEYAMILMARARNFSWTSCSIILKCDRQRCYSLHDDALTGLVMSINQLAWLTPERPTTLEAVR